MDMESAFHGIENEDEVENRLNLPETVNTLMTSSSNIKQNLINKNRGKKLVEKDYEILEKLGNFIDGRGEG